MAACIPRLTVQELRAARDDAEILRIIEAACNTGAVVITDVPELRAARDACLRSVHRFARLPDATKRTYERPEIQYADGWSCGTERFLSGQPDRRKGSFYFNPCVRNDVEPQSEVAHRRLHCLKPVWPTEVPEMEASCLALTELIQRVATDLVEALDTYLAAHVAGFVRGRLSSLLRSSTAHKGRALCYFPPEATDDAKALWCGEHVDHGMITGLVASMHLPPEGGDAVPCPDETAGLYIRGRDGGVQKATYPEDALFFQFGETLQIFSGGYFPATRHFVSAIRRDVALDLHRLTFAVFFNPDVDVEMRSPNDVDCGVVHFESGETFSQFSAKTFDRYY